MTITRGDYVKAIKGAFEGKRGWVSRVDEYNACIVWKGVWEHGRLLMT
jgi:ribosomal protein L24